MWTNGSQQQPTRPKPRPKQRRQPETEHAGGDKGNHDETEQAGGDEGTNNRDPEDTSATEAIPKKRKSRSSTKAREESNGEETELSEQPAPKKAKQGMKAKGK